MEWLRAHPYTSALSGAGLLILIGIFIVEQRTARPVETAPTAWGGGTVPLLNPTSYGPSQGTLENRGNIMQDVKSGPPYTYVPPAHLATSVDTENVSDDFESFVAMLRKDHTSSTPPLGGDTSLMSAYAYVPHGLISTTTPRTGQTAVQKTIYDYGNDIGSSIESFEQQNSNMVQILKAQVEDRSDPDKAAAVVSIGHALEDLGRNLSAMDTVPSGMAGAHTALAQSYIEIGKKLALIPQAERDADFIQAIQAYNASADVFTKNYIQLVSFFGVYGVTFTSTDSGRVFTFSPTGF